MLSACVLVRLNQVARFIVIRALQNLRAGISNAAYNWVALQATRRFGYRSGQTPTCERTQMTLTTRSQKAENLGLGFAAGLWARKESPC